MSEFSRMLRAQIEKRGITVVSLAKQCGIDRATLHKIISGERKPPTPGLVEDLGRLLMLSAKEQEKLSELYNICLMGEDLYRRRNSVKQLIREMSFPGSGKAQGLYYETDFQVGGSEPISTVYGAHDICQTLVAIMASEMKNGSDICIIAQPDPDLFRVLNLVLALSEKCTGQINHVFCLDNRGEGDGPNDYNLSVFPDICELTATYGSYRPMYYYDHVNEHINSTSLLPVLVVTDNYAVCISLENNSMISYCSPTAVEFYKNEFERMRGHCYPYICRYDNKDIMISHSGSSEGFRIIIDRQPLLMLVSDEDICRKAFRMPKEHIEAFIGVMKSLQETDLGRDIYQIFTEEGLRMFMHSGKINLIKEAVPLEPALRLEMLRRMIELNEKNLCIFRFIDNDHAPSYRLRLIKTDCNKVKLIMRRPDKNVFLEIKEQSSSIAISDYIDYLISSGIVYSADKTISILKKILAESEASFARK